MNRIILLFVLVSSLASFGFAQAPTPPPAPSAAPPAAPPSAPVPITDADLKGVAAPAADARAKGDPDGSLTGTVSDIAVADPITDKTPKAKGLTIGDVVNQVGQ